MIENETNGVIHIDNIKYRLRKYTESLRENEIRYVINLKCIDEKIKKPMREHIKTIVFDNNKIPKCLEVIETIDEYITIKHYKVERNSDGKTAKVTIYSPYRKQGEEPIVGNIYIGESMEQFGGLKGKRKFETDYYIAKKMLDGTLTTERMQKIPPEYKKDIDMVSRLVTNRILKRMGYLSLQYEPKRESTEVEFC